MLTAMSNKHSDAMSQISEHKAWMAKKIKNGETEEEFAIGGESYTEKEWDKLVDQVDESIDAIKEEQQEDLKKRESEEKIKDIYEELASKSQSRELALLERMEAGKSKVPYAFLAKDGVISYNGVSFICDESQQAICLGDVSNKENVLTIPLENGGSLMVNRDNLGELANAMDMFSPEDKKRILWAISTDHKIESEKAAIEEAENSIGDSAEEKLFAS